MTNIYSGLSGVQGTLCSQNNLIYFSDGFDPVLVWDGVALTAQNAGIVGPTGAAVPGTQTTGGVYCTAGTHGLRYRYQNSKTGFVSNPSPYMAVSNSNSFKFNFVVGSGTNPASLDLKVDTILIEMTPANSGNYYQVAAIPNVTGTTYTVQIPDTTLTAGFDSDANYGSTQDNSTFTHYPPPGGTIILNYKGRCWIMGNVPYVYANNVLWTNNSTTVLLPTGGSSLWPGMLIIKPGDQFANTIASVSGTTVTLVNPYPGTSGLAGATVYSPTPNRGYYSRAFAPEEFYPGVYARDFLTNRSDILTAAIGRKEAMYIFGLFSSERLIYNDDPSAITSVISPIQGNRGCFNQRCLVEAEGVLYSFDRQGVWQVAEIPQHISFNVDDTLKEMCDYSQYAQFHGVYDPVDRVVMFFFCALGTSTGPTYAACFEIDSGRWWFNNWLVPITASGIIPTSDGQVRAMLVDANGYSWFFGVDGSYDGVPPSSPTILNITSGSNPYTVSQTVPTSGMAGIPAYSSGTGQVTYVTATTASTITFAAALTDGGASPVWLGPINFIYLSKWWTGHGQEFKKSPVYLAIRMHPSNAGAVANVYIYTDFSNVPQSPTAFIGDQPPDGVTYVPGEPYFQVSLTGGINNDGFVSVPLIANYQRSMRFKITCMQPTGPIRIVGVDFIQTDSSQESSVPSE